VMPYEVRDRSPRRVLITVPVAESMILTTLSPVAAISRLSLLIATSEIGPRNPPASIISSGDEVMSSPGTRATDTLIPDGSPSIGAPPAMLPPAAGLPPGSIGALPGAGASSKRIGAFGPFALLVFGEPDPGLPGGSSFGGGAGPRPGAARTGGGGPCVSPPLPGRSGGNIGGSPGSLVGAGGRGTSWANPGFPPSRQFAVQNSSASRTERVNIRYEWNDKVMSGALQLS